MLSYVAQLQPRHAQCLKTKSNMVLMLILGAVIKKKLTVMIVIFTQITKYFFIVLN